MKKILILLLLINKKYYSYILDNAYQGKLIKTHKSELKNKIEENIEKNIEELFKTVTDQKVTMDKSFLSASAMSRYCGQSYYIKKDPLYNSIINDQQISKKSCNQNNTILFNFLSDKIAGIENKIQKTYPLQSILFQKYILLLLINNILQGQSIAASLPEIKSAPLLKNNIIALLLAKKTVASAFAKNDFDRTAEEILLKTFICNGADRVEKDRITNRIINSAARKPILIITELFDPNNFTQAEVNNTFGEMTPSRDIYQKILFNPNQYYKTTEARYQMMHRNIPDQKGTCSFYIAIPLIADNMVTYYIMENGKKIKLNEFINSVTKNKFFMFTILSANDARWLLT